MSGFCVSYKETKSFEMAAAASQGTDIPGITPGHFVRYSGSSLKGHSLERTHP